MFYERLRQFQQTRHLRRLIQTHFGHQIDSVHHETVKGIKEVGYTEG
jgi:hypothetical protein